MRRPRTAIAFGIFVILLLAGGGYLLGASKATTESDAEDARAASYEESVESAYQSAFDRSRARGARSGARDGRIQGQAAGARRGAAAGEVAAQAELTELAAAEAEAARQAALAETQERIQNCGAPLFVEGYCPTDEEVLRESQAESLCGPGTPEGKAEAAELGITCRVAPR